MSFNIFNIFSKNFWTQSKNTSYADRKRSPARLRAIESEYRPHDKGRGQQQNNSRHPVSLEDQRSIYLHNSWVRRCIDHIATNAAASEWHITTDPQYLGELANDERLRFAKELVMALLERPNRVKNTFRDIISIVVRDLKIFDAAILEKVRDEDGRLVELKPVDPTTVLVDTDEYGNVLGYKQNMRNMVSHGMFINKQFPRSSSNYNNEALIHFPPEDIIFIKLNPRSGSPYGSSPLSTLMDTVAADNNSDVNLNTFLATGGSVPGIISINRELDDVTAEIIKTKLMSHLVPGGRYNMPIIGFNEELKFIPLHISNQEMQIAELQKQLHQKILAVLSVPPNELGLSGGTRGQVYSQQEVFWGGCILPMLGKIAEELTYEILREFDPRLRFEFLPPKEYQFEAKIARLKTLDEMGLISDETKYAELSLPIPKESTYIQRMKQIELENAELRLEAARLDIEIKRKTLDVSIEAPREELKQLQMQTDSIEDSKAIEDEQIKLQHEQIDVERESLQIQDKQLDYQEALSEKEYKINQLQAAMELAQLSDIYKQTQGGHQQQEQITEADIMEGIASGELGDQEIAQLVAQGVITPEQLKNIRDIENTKQKVTDAKGESSQGALGKSIGNIDSLSDNLIKFDFFDLPDIEEVPNIAKRHEFKFTDSLSNLLDGIFKTGIQGIDDEIKHTENPGEGYVKRDDRINKDPLKYDGKSAAEQEKKREDAGEIGDGEEQ